MRKFEYVGAVLLEDGDEITCSSPCDEQDAWRSALKKKIDLEMQDIIVEDVYVFQVAA